MDAPGFRSGATDVAKPPLRARWFHSNGAAWVVFSDTDDAILERWWVLNGDEMQMRAAAKANSNASNSSSSSSRRSWFPDILPYQLWSSESATTSVIPPPAPPQSKGHVAHFTDPDEPEETRRFKVPVMEDRLYDVDMLSGILYPALWTGLEQAVVRATWFYVSTDCTLSPIAWDSALARDLDTAYEKMQPWTLKQRLRVLQSDMRAPNPSCDLPSVIGGARVSFDDAYTGRIYLSNIGGAILSYLRDSIVVRGFDRVQQVLERFRKNRPAGMLDFVGYRRPENDVSSSWPNIKDSFFTRNILRSPKQNSDDSESSDNENEQVLDPGIDPALVSVEKSPARSYSAQKSQHVQCKSESVHIIKNEPRSNEQGSPRGPLDDSDKPVASLEDDVFSDYCPTTEHDGVIAGAGPATDINANDSSTTQPESDTIPKDSAQQRKTVHLVFCVHGIGQKLADNYASLDFTHDVERLQDLCRQKMYDEDLKNMIGTGQIKLIPICWRRLLDFDPIDYGLSDLFLETTM